MRTKVAILQSAYIPWKGYFDLIHDVDVFVFYDDVQYTKQDWRNRNKIKTPDGARWITVPVGDDLRRRICDVVISDSRWQARHWKTLCQNYARAPHFARYRGFLESVYLKSTWQSLSMLNQCLIQEIAANFLGVRTTFRDSREFRAKGDRVGRIVDIVRATGSATYVTGPAARSYLEEDRFREAGIAIEYKSYTGYPEYSQFFPPFDHFISVLDLLFHVGPDSAQYIWGWRNTAVC